MSRTIPTRIHMPVDLRRRLREAAARAGCSAHDLILEGIRDMLDRRDAAAGVEEANAAPDETQPAGMAQPAPEPAAVLGEADPAEIP